ncbi:MAG: hypothetical protein HC834_07025 [Rhodospirillales bacterium]|nr:hypothetical protein [Rhodospirillales bacterium]
MPIYQVTPIFGQTVMGASETYISRLVSAPAAAAAINLLVAKRNDILYRDYHYWQGVRVSIYDTKRRSTAYLPGTSNFPGGGQIVVPSRGTFIATGGAVPDPASETTRPDQFRAVMQYRISYDTDRSTIRYLSGIPDSMSGTEAGTLQKQADPAWWTKWEAFAGHLVSAGWQIRARHRGPYDEHAASGLVVREAGPAQLGVVVPALPDLGYEVGNKVHLKGWRRMGRGGLSLNGKYFIDNVNTTQISGSRIYFLRGTEGQDPAQWKILGTIQLVGYDTFPIEDVNHHRVGIHKRGRPTMAPRGRRLTRLTLDP